MLNDRRSHGLWERTAPPPPATERLAGDIVADVGSSARATPAYRRCCILPSPPHHRQRPPHPPFVQNYQANTVTC
jgi:hypothetical protein